MMYHHYVHGLNAFGHASVAGQIAPAAADCDRPHGKKISGSSAAWAANRITLPKALANLSDRSEAGQNRAGKIQ
jgi:hypothetical protein